MLFTCHSMMNEKMFSQLLINRVFLGVRLAIAVNTLKIWPHPFRLDFFSTNIVEYKAFENEGKFLDSNLFHADGKIQKKSHHIWSIENCINYRAISWNAIFWETNERELSKIVQIH